MISTAVWVRSLAVISWLTDTAGHSFVENGYSREVVSELIDIKVFFISLQTCVFDAHWVFVAQRLGVWRRISFHCKPVCSMHTGCLLHSDWCMVAPPSGWGRRREGEQRGSVEWVSEGWECLTTKRSVPCANNGTCVNVLVCKVNEAKRSNLAY